MDLTDVSAAACLHVLLEDQARRLRVLAGRIADAAGTRMPPADEWSGLAREAHDECVRRLEANLEAARSTLARAASESSRAASSLAGRV